MRDFALTPVGHRSAEQILSTRHAWMIDHATGAICHDEISRRALAKVRDEFTRCNATIADATIREPAKRHHRAVVAQGVEARWRLHREIMTDSARHIAWQWRVAHGDLSDTYIPSASEIAGLSTDGRI